MVLWKKEITSDKKRVLLQRLEAPKMPSTGLVQLDLAREYIALSAMLDWDTALSEHDRAEIVWDVLGHISKQELITENDVIRELNQAEQAVLQNGIQDFVVCTYISIDPKLKVPLRRLDGATITISPNPPPRFLREFAKTLTQAALPYLRKVPGNYQSVRISVKAPTQAAAFSKAGDSLDLLRALWNFPLNCAKGQRWSMSGNRKPVNSIVTLPIFSLHTPSGALATPIWWVDPSQISLPHLPYNDNKGFEKLLKEEQNARRMLSRHTYRQDLENALRRYVGALDRSDWTSAFLQLWSLLELLTGVRGRDSHEQVVKRCAFWFRPDDFNRLTSLILDALRRYRNSYVHSSEFTSESEAIMYTAKYYVERMLLFHLRNQFRFQSIQESTVLLDMPSELSHLRCHATDLERKQQGLSKKFKLTKQVIQILESAESDL